MRSLVVYLEYFDDALRKSGKLTYKVNLRHAKSVFSIDCPNRDCVSGDFDLSGGVVEAANGGRKVVDGRIACHGWHTNAKQAKVLYHNSLRNNLSLTYAA